MQWICEPASWRGALGAAISCAAGRTSTRLLDDTGCSTFGPAAGAKRRIIDVFAEKPVVRLTVLNSEEARLKNASAGFMRVRVRILAYDSLARDRSSRWPRP